VTNRDLVEAAGEAGALRGIDRRRFLRLIAAIGAGSATSGMWSGLGVRTPQANASVPMRATVDATHPAHLINFGQDDALHNDSIVALWSTVPAELKPVVFINLVPGADIRNVPAQTNWIRSALDYATANQIPVTVQVANGQTGTTNSIPVSQWQSWAQAYPVYFKGFNAAELYNGPDQSAYLVSLFQLAGQMGMYFFWTDTNYGGANGMMLNYMESNSAFLPTMKANAQNLVFMNKESFATNGTDALNKGLWLTGYIGNWGSSTDWWHWGIDGQGVFPGGSGGQDWKYILQYPQGLQMQSIVRDMSQGATAFLAEASFFSNGALGHRYAPAQFGMYPLLHDVVRGRIQIPSRAQVAAQTKAIAKGKANFTTPRWDTSVNDAMAVDGRYGLLPLVPTTMPNADLAGYNVITAPQPQSYYDGLYPGFASSGDGWLVRTDTASRQWFYTNPYMWVQRSTSSTFAPSNLPGTSVTISSAEHTSVIVQENATSLGFHVYNYRLNLTNALSTVVDKSTTFDFGQNYMAPVLDSAGNPVVNPDGSVPTVGGFTLPDRTFRDVRNVTIAIVGTWNGGQPVVVFDDYVGQTRPYTQTQTWNGSTHTLVLSLTMNGMCNFNIKVNAT
jgi:hypothetical protein